MHGNADLFFQSWMANAIQRSSERIATPGPLANAWTLRSRLLLLLFEPFAHFFTKARNDRRAETR
jgi:hypothetical protein